MADYNIEKQVNERKKKIFNLAKVFIAAMLLLTFFSKTMYNWTLPTVKYETVSTGNLTVEITVEGIVEAKGRVEYYTDISAAIEDVMVSVGDEVKKGDKLFILEKESLNLELDRKKLELAELKLQHSQMCKAEEANTREQRLYQLKADLAHKEKIYKDYLLLYEKGAEAEAGLKEKSMEYEAAKAEYEIMGKELSVEAQNNEKEIEAQIIRIRLKELELMETEKKLDKCVITAPFSGIIKEINFKKGMVLNDTIPVYVLDSMDDGFEFKADLAAEQCEYINPGDEVKVYVKNKADSQLDGIVKTIDAIKGNQDKKTVTVDLDKAELDGGEIGELYLRKKAGTYDYLVPRAAVYKDSEGSFVYVLQEKDGPLGIEYYALWMQVTTGDSDYSRTGIYSGLLGDEKVIISTNKELSDGCQVILEN